MSIATLAVFPPSFLKPEAKQDVLDWIAVWPFPIETKKATIRLWAKTFQVDISKADWHHAIPEEVQT